mmetsp:Transcript_16066/g.19556  ORF Transcript_16066/g.19556 Transcript_16066/m.19556 type:complete len:155 (-) Transcript_16066:52-516(-)
MRLYTFLARCHDVLDLTKTTIQFSKLSKVEIGGTKGKDLTSSIQEIYLDFQNAVDTFKAIEYDLMDADAHKFEVDYSTFCSAVKEIERRLGAVISSGVDDCLTVYGRFQLLDSFDSDLLHRSIIQDELEGKYIELVHAFGTDLRIAQEQFLSSY